LGVRADTGIKDGFGEGASRRRKTPEPAAAIEKADVTAAEAHDMVAGLELGNADERAEYKNFTPIALGMLWAILRREKWDARRRDLEHVCRAENGESWLLRFPDELTHLLSVLDEPTVDAVAKAWVNREVPGNSEELKPALRDLKRLAAQAQKNGGTLYLWGSS
jgi:hypothetical protein